MYLTYEDRLAGTYVLRTILPHLLPNEICLYGRLVNGRVPSISESSGNGTLQHRTQSPPPLGISPHHIQNILATGVGVHWAQTTFTRSSCRHTRDLLEGAGGLKVSPFSTAEPLKLYPANCPSRTPRTDNWMLYVRRPPQSWFPITTSTPATSYNMQSRYRDPQSLHDKRVYIKPIPAEVYIMGHCWRVDYQICLLHLPARHIESLDWDQLRMSPAGLLVALLLVGGMSEPSYKPFAVAGKN